GIPQRHQPLAAERGSMQVLTRTDRNVARIELWRGLATQRDPVIADNVHAHRGFSCLRGGGAAGDPTDALLADQSHSIPDNLVALFGAVRAWNAVRERWVRAARI